jgi:hypothetical protein
MRSTEQVTPGAGGCVFARAREAMTVNDRICLIDYRDGRTREAFPAAPHVLARRRRR